MLGKTTNRLSLEKGCGILKPLILDLPTKLAGEESY
jgi:hypothetical protein